MSAPAKDRFSSGVAGWVVALLFFGFLAFLLLPFEWGEKPTPVPMSVAAESRLQAVGLSDNVDWEGLPQFFAVWADQAEWKDGKTRFAYWHPVTKDYTYFFEATQTVHGYRFSEIVEPSFENYSLDEKLDEDCPIRFYRIVEGSTKLQLPPVVTSDPAGKDTRLDVKVESAAQTLPPADLQSIPETPATKP